MSEGGDDKATFGLELLDKMSGPAEKIVGGLEGASGALEKLHGSSGKSSEGLSRVARATEYLTLALRGIQIAQGAIELTRALGGIGKVKDGIMRAGAALKQFGVWAFEGLKKAAPFIAGGAGVYGLGKVAMAAIPAVGGLGASIGAVSIAAGGAALAVGYVVAKVGELTFKAVEATAEFATFGQNSRMAFNALAKHGASGNKLFEHARGLAQEFGQDVMDTTDSFKKLLAGGFNPRLGTEVLKMGADMRFLGSSAEEVKGAVRAITQIKAAGRLQGDELNQLAEAGIGANTVYEALAKRLGKTVPEVMKLKQAGKIDWQTAVGGILDAVKNTTGEKELGDVGKQWANSSIAGMTARIKARGQNVMMQLGDRLAPTLQRLAGGALDRVDKFLANPESDKLIMQIGNTFDVMGDVAVKALPLVAAFFEAMGGRGADILMGVNAAVDAMGGGSVDGAAEVMAKLGHGMADAVFYGGVLIGVVGAVLGAFAGLTSFLLVDLPNLPARFFGIGVDIAKGIGDGVKSAAMYPINAVRELGDQALGTLRSMLRIRSPSKAFGELGAYAAMGFAVGISAHAGGAAEAGRAMARDTAAATEAAMPNSYAPVTGFAPPGRFDVSGLASRGAIQFSLVQHIDGSGLDANEVAQLSARESRRAIEDFFRQLDNEA